MWEFWKTQHWMKGGKQSFLPSIRTTSNRHFYYYYCIIIYIYFFTIINFNQDFLYLISQLYYYKTCISSSYLYRYTHIEIYFYPNKILTKLVNSCFYAYQLSMYTTTFSSFLGNIDFEYLLASTPPYPHLHNYYEWN